MTKELVAGISADVYNLPLEIPNDMVIIRTTNVLGHDTGFSLSSLPLEEGQGEGAAPYSAVYACDHQGRMVWKQACATAVWTNGTWQATESRAFLYDGWNVVQETINHQPSTTNYYTWGLDLSGSIQGAGGIGGLLSASLDGTTAHYCYDANGNVGQLVGPDGDLLAHYDYSPFGEAIVATGPLAKTNPFRFSTKHWDDLTGLGYWGYRYYHPEMGRWMNRDPIGEKGGINIYGYVYNRGVNNFDALGYDIWTETIVEKGSVAVFTWYHSYYVLTYDDEACTISISGPTYSGVTVVPPNTAHEVAEVFNVQTVQKDKCCTESNEGGHEETKRYEFRIRKWIIIGFKGFGIWWPIETIILEREIKCKCR